LGHNPNNQGAMEVKHAGQGKRYPLGRGEHDAAGYTSQKNQRFHVERPVAAQTEEGGESRDGGRDEGPTGE